MRKSDERGLLNALMIPFILLCFLFICLAAFAVWAFMSRQDYKNNVDQKISSAVGIAKQQTATAKDAEFVQKEKNPLKTYLGPESFGSISVQYPKTWSAFVTENGPGLPIDGYFHPGFVPGIQSGTSFALRLQVTNNSYDKELQLFDGLVREGKVRVSPYRPPKVNVTGARLEGAIVNAKQGYMVMFPLRDKTLKLWTEAEDFHGDFDNIILANLNFVP